MTMSRRDFLALVGAVAAATGLPDVAVAETLVAHGQPARAAAELTTLAQTLRAGPEGDKGYRPVVSGGGEPHVVRDDLAAARSGRQGRRRSLLSFVHHTDQHIIDSQSPSRVEFLDRYAEDQCDQSQFSLTSAHRPHEAASARVADAMQQRVRRIGVSPVTGAPLTAAICTGDNTDNRQRNELDVFLGVMNGDWVTPQSGDSKTYQGVQASGDRAYWHPDPGVRDRYKQHHGFPDSPGFLERALAPFDAVGAGMPWYTCYGNHDGLAQGNAPPNPAFQAVGTGPAKVVGAPAGTNPCTQFDDVGFLPGVVGVYPTRRTRPDADRRYVSRQEWIRAHLEDDGMPTGHGFAPDNVDDDRAYYTADVGGLRWIVLDTVNPGGYASGSVGEEQLAWLKAQLAKAQGERRLTMLFSHHGLRSLTNPSQNPDPLLEDGNDLPRHNADAVLAVVSTYSCVIGWVNGHTHRNVIEAQSGPQSSFWDIGTAAHIDWPAQSRLIDVVDNRDGTLSIFTTMVDHDADELVGFARELCGNDPQKGFGYGDGTAADRNCELLVAHPFPQAPPAAQPAAAGAGHAGPQGAGVAGAPAQPAPADTSGGPQPTPVLPVTGGGSGLSLGGALVAAGAIGVRTLHRRAQAITARPPAPE